MSRPLLKICLLLLMITCWGCGSGPLNRKWAGHTYPDKTNSVNGLSYFERLCTSKGARFKQINRLSPRMDRVDCLILLGDTFQPPSMEARDWIEEWLGKKSGRKVIYLGRDFDAAEIYLESTVAQQPPTRQARARLDLAQVRSERDEKLYDEMNADYFCRWFFVRTSKPERVLKKFSGPWAENLSDQAKWPVRGYFDWPDPELQSKEPDWNSPEYATSMPAFRRMGPGRARAAPLPPTQPNAKRTVFSTQWEPRDISDTAAWESEWENAPNVEKLLVGEDDTPLVMRLTSENYPGSEIITLANGAPLFNAMMVDADMRALCLRVADEVGDDARVAYLPYGLNGIQISQIPDMEDEITGLSVLMTWPLNILMAHLAFLGVLICIALFPILGRPQNLKSSSLSDFGQHAEAMGQLLYRTRDWPFALRMVSDYLRIVRGESLPSWLQSELAHHLAPPSLPPNPALLPNAGLPPNTPPANPSANPFASPNGNQGQSPPPSMPT